MSPYQLPIIGTVTLVQLTWWLQRISGFLNLFLLCKPASRRFFLLILLLEMKTEMVSSAKIMCEHFIYINNFIKSKNSRETQKTKGGDVNFRKIAVIVPVFLS